MNDAQILYNILGREDLLPKIKEFFQKNKDFKLFKGFTAAAKKSGEIFSCIYCGKDVISLNGNLVSEFGEICFGNSPNKKHKLISQAGRCVYCGEKTKVVGKEIITNRGAGCKNAPNKKHTFN
jgi:hypothetical protein